MKNDPYELLRRSLDEPLDDEERRSLAMALRGSETLREERRRLLAMRREIASGRSISFAPGFADRVMRKLGTIIVEKDLWFDFDTLVGLFHRVILIGSITAASIALFNVADRPAPVVSSSPFGAVFALPADNIMTANELDPRGMP